MSRGMITVQGKDHPHTRGLGGAGLRYTVGEPQAIARRVLAGEAFDAAEIALSAALILADRGGPRAIPVFPARDDVHGHVFVRRESPLRGFEELAGKRIALRDFSSTPACWFRGLLTEIGVEWRSLAWEAGARARFAPPPGAVVTASTADPEQRLLDGEVDAVLSAQVRDAGGELRPLLDDPRAVAEAWRRRTGILPIIHTVLVSDAAGPAAPRAVFAAYAAARRRAGADGVPPYGLTPGNRAAVERLAADLAEQGLIRTALPIAALFHPGAETWRDED
ncbi:MAG TPA: hypothetical protein VGN83_23030 [Falsiroseomonas sp.]|jgi:4,5-dihydroxyphthalate decarboxylase|nr:hypothetical protein [Falsiroseomonas sp.]